MRRKLSRRFKVAFFCWLTVLPLAGQVSIIDSLKNELNGRNPAPEARAEVFSQLGREYIFIDPLVSGKYLEDALALADSIGDRELKAHVLRNLGSLLSIQGYFAEGIELLFQSKTIVTELNDSVGIGNCFISLGIIYEDQGILDSAIINTGRAIEIFQRLHLQERLGISYNNIASQYNTLGNYDSSEYFIEKAIEINSRSENNAVLVSNIRIKAKNAFSRGLYKTSKDLCQAVLNMYSRNPGGSNLEAVSDCGRMLSEIYLQEGMNDSIEHHINMSIELAEKQGYFLQLKNAYLTKLKYLTRVGSQSEVDSALAHFEYSNESFIENERRNRMAMINWVESLMQKESEISYLSRENEKDTQIIKNQQYQLAIVGVILIFISVYAISNRQFSKKLKELNESLKTKSEEIKAQNEQLLQQQEKIAEERSFVRSLINGLPLFMGLTDENGNFLIANRQYYEQFSLEGIKIEGKNYKEILPDFVLKKHEPRILNGLKGEASEFEESYRSDDGDKRRYFHGKYIPQVDKNGKVKQLIFFTAEITEIKEAQRKLQELNDSKNKLFSIVAHDFKSPINTVLGFSDLLMKNADSFSKEELQKVADDMNRSVRKTLTLAENLLTWAQTQMDQVQSNQQETPLFQEVNRTVDQLIPVAEKKKIKLVNDVSKETVVYVDRNHLDLILRNIINNAIKFSNKGGKVTVSSRVKNEMAEVTVSDDGVGMDQDTVNQLFNNYMKSNLGTEGEMGTGLGLMLCKEYIESNGGEIRVESEPRKGSKFHFSIRLFDPQSV